MLSTKVLRTTKDPRIRKPDEPYRLIFSCTSPVTSLIILEAPAIVEVTSMPYTPPSQRSPAASTHESPVLTRSNSYLNSPDNGPNRPSSGLRPGLPRSSSSTSYLNRERRSPSLQQNPTPDATPDEEEIEVQRTMNPTSSLRQSPPPVNDSLIPTGAVISPPDSAQNSSDDEEPERGRARELELKQLKDAVSAIDIHRQGSPEVDNGSGGKPKLALDLSAASPRSKPMSLASPPLSKEARKISHSRSNTDTVVMDFARPTSESPSSESDFEEPRMKKPPMLRKKSGELVRPALRPPSARRRPSSMPGTPTYSKAVHFDNNLEHVRHFLQVDRPLAVSAGSSPVELHEGETEFPFNHGDNQSSEPPWQWELRTPNFPQDFINRSHLPVRVEKVFVSSDNKTLVGTVAVQNLAFHKFVVARFTLDYWKTTSEVSAEYSHDVRHEQIKDGRDRFNFSMKLEDQTNLEKKTLFFCVRYSVNGQDFWDSNGGVNYQVDFAKKALPQKGKSGTPGNISRPLNASPRSRQSPVLTGRQRPVSVPTFDDFAHGFDSPFGLSSPPTAAALVGEKPIKFRGKGSDTIVPDAPGLRPKNQSQAFGTRYDFGASLSATKPGGTSAESSGSFASPSFFPPANTTSTLQEPQEAPESTNGEDNAQKPAALSEKPALESQSYHDLINKYCFVRSTKRTRDGIGEIEC